MSSLLSVQCPLSFQHPLLLLIVISINRHGIRAPIPQTQGILIEQEPLSE